MAQNNKQNSNVIAIITMFFIFAMISFVTNMAAPFGNIWGYKYTWAGMMGNMMNFAAYLFMGIPAGKMLTTVGYKKTSLIALGVGVVGLFLQYLSSIFGADIAVFSYDSPVDVYSNGAIVEQIQNVSVTLNLFIYLLGAFICGFCVCMLNTVVNPMLNMLGGSGNKGNQLIQAGGALNSLSGTLTPFLVGALIGSVTRHTSMSDVAPLLFIGIGIFIVAFFVIIRVNIPEPALERMRALKAKGLDKVNKYEHSAWSFRHFVLGAIAIFFYVGIEIGIPGELNFYLSNPGENGAGLLANGAVIGGAIAAIYWLLMLVGRTLSSAISGKVSTRVQMITVSSVGIILVVLAIATPKETGMKVPSFIYNPVEKTTEILKDVNVPEVDIQKFLADPTSVDLKKYEKALFEEKNVRPESIPYLPVVPKVPMSALYLVLCGLCTSVMWGGIFNLCVEGLGKYTEQASGIFMMLVVGGGIMPLIQDMALRPTVGYINSYWLIVAMLCYLLFYGVLGCKNVNTDIPVEVEDPNGEDMRDAI